MSTMNINSSSRQIMPRFSTPQAEEKARKSADDRRQMRRIGGDDSGDADIKEQEKVKVLRLRGN